MPVRTFEVILTNNSGFPLTKTFEHLCGGDWTPGLHPPDMIPPGQAQPWQSESDGLATGTEGYVKYKVGATTGDTVYIYWDNPFAFGVTKAFCKVSTTDVEPDCDFEKTSGGAVFPGAPSRFEVHTTSMT